MQHLKTGLFEAEHRRCTEARVQRACAGSAGDAARAAATISAVPGGAAGPPAELDSMPSQMLLQCYRQCLRETPIYISIEVSAADNCLPDQCGTYPCHCREDSGERSQLTHLPLLGAAPREQRTASRTARPPTAASAAPARGGAHPHFSEYYSTMRPQAKLSCSGVVPA
jgi:hypothetical protein